jgi:protein phosphatase
VEVDASMESPLPGDIYLLCSDGLSRMVKDEEIQQTLGSVKDLEEATKILIDKANQGGGRDNITTILVRVQDAKGASAGTMPARTATAPS